MLEGDESQGSTQSCTTLIEQRDYQLSYFTLIQALSDNPEFFLPSKWLKRCSFAWLCLSNKVPDTHTQTHTFTSRLFSPQLGNGWRC